MPKVDKATKIATARANTHPTNVKKASVSSKKKKKGAANPKHDSGIGEQLAKMADPGKLKPIKAQPTKVRATNADEQKMESQLMHAAASSRTKKAGKTAQLADAMEEDGEDEQEYDADLADDEEQMAADETAQISARLSKKILQQVNAQQREELDGEGVEEEREGANNSAKRMRQLVSLTATVDGDEEMSDADEDDDEEDYDDDGAALDDVELSPEDQASLEMFMPKANTTKGKTLADVLMEKIREKEQQAAGQGAPSSSHGSNVHFGAGFGMPVTAQQQQQQDATEMVRAKLDPKIVEVYTKVGKFLSHYTSGKIPKAFKLIPNLKSWEEILYLTQPDNWSSQAHFVATRIFSSNFNPKMAQRFYSIILLPKVRGDIESNKHLNFHLYQAIKKSLYKPAAFFKGLLLPMAEEGATAREAVIMSSILAKCTIPALHSSVALLKLGQMPYSGTTALFMKTLLNKKYSLPRKVLTSLFQYFCAFLHKSAGGASLGAMPLIWHQTLLVFVQRYKLELSANQITALKNLIKVQSHHGITAEIRRELAAVQNQGASGAGTGTGAAAGAQGYQFGQLKSAGPLTTAQPNFASFSLTPGFTSLAASIKNPTQFHIPSPADTASAAAAMEQ